MKTITTIIALISVSSCTPTGYIVNTAPYADIIATNPEKVLVSPEHVEVVGGFQADFGGSIITDQGTVGIGPDGVSGNVVIDLTSGK